MFKKLAKVIGFAAVLVSIFALATRVLVPEWFWDDMWPTTSTLAGFYELEEDSLDVLAMGSSAGQTAVIPQVLYDEYGLSSYNLSFEKQNMLSAYYWLKEALQYQHPSVVLLECRYYFEPDSNLPEMFFRKAFDPMRLSPVKKEAIKAVCEIDPEESELSYYLPLLRFHARWSDLGYKASMEYYERGMSMNELLGYRAFVYAENEDEGREIAAFEEDMEVKAFPAGNINGLYMDKIVELCKEEGIDLVLYHGPSVWHRVDRWKTLVEYGEANNLPYIDFTTARLMEELEYEYHQHSEGGNHPNIAGAAKITRYLGDFLQENYKIEKKYKESAKALFDAARPLYEGLTADYELKHITNIEEYLEAVNSQKDRYIVFLSVKDDGAQHLSEEAVEALKNIGFEAKLEGLFRSSYLAIYNDGVVMEEAADELLESSGKFGNAFTYYACSAGGNSGAYSSVVINGDEYSSDMRGVNAVVYDKYTRSVIDMACFDTCADGSCTRKHIYRHL